MRQTLGHPYFKEKNILVVVAHPDDESLYFCGGLKQLSEISQVTLLCATHPQHSERGKEIQSVCRALGIHCHFLELPDFGIRSLLPELDLHFKKYLDGKKYDLFITHPPHGGEKPHPHHLQVFLTTFSHCLRSGLKFAFFSESPLSLCEASRKAATWSLSWIRLLSLFTVQTWLNLEWRYRFKWLQVFKPHLTRIVKSLFDQSILFTRFDIQVSSDERRSLLSHHASQKQVLESYSSIDLDHEYLFFMRSSLGIRRSVSRSDLEDWSRNHEFKMSTGQWISSL